MPSEPEATFYPFLAMGVVGLDESQPVVRVIAYEAVLRLALRDERVKILLHAMLDKAMEGTKPPDDRPKDVIVKTFRLPA